MLSSVEHEKSFITSEPDLLTYLSSNMNKSILLRIYVSEKQQQLLDECQQ